MSTFKGDFTGFSFKGIHSSSLGITRVSNGDRYVKHLSPSFKSQTVEVPGADGMYYFGKNFTQHKFQVHFGFDAVSEADIKHMQQLFNVKGCYELIFDEEPYKAWDAQIDGQPQLKFICFDEEKYDDEFYDLYAQRLMKAGERIYKGEGEITFVCYSPNAHSPKNKKYLDQYDDTKYTPKHQWASTSGLVESDFYQDNIGEYDGTIDTFYISGNTNHCQLFNAGQKETPFVLKVLMQPIEEKSKIDIYLVNNQKKELKMSISVPINCSGLEINTKTQLINILNLNGDKTGTIISQEKGNFFNLPIGQSEIQIYSEALSCNCEISYNYLYY